MRWTLVRVAVKQYQLRERTCRTDDFTWRFQPRGRGSFLGMLASVIISRGFRHGDHNVYTQNALEVDMAQGTFAGQAHPAVSRFTNTW